MFNSQTAGENRGRDIFPRKMVVYYNVNSLLLQLTSLFQELLIIYTSWNNNIINQKCMRNENMMVWFIVLIFKKTYKLAVISLPKRGGGRRLSDSFPCPERWQFTNRSL